MKSFISFLPILILSLVFSFKTGAQTFKSYQLTSKGDTINRIDKTDRKQGPWIARFEELRGEPGFEEEGYYLNDKKEGAWRKFKKHTSLTPSKPGVSGPMAAQSLTRISCRSYRSNASHTKRQPGSCRTVKRCGIKMTLSPLSTLKMGMQCIIHWFLHCFVHGMIQHPFNGYNNDSYMV